MIFFILGILALIMSLLFFGFINKDKGFKLNKWQWLILVTLLLFTSLSFFKIVPAGSVGVVTSFGKIEDYTLDAGMHLGRPWAKVIKMNNRTQKQIFTLSCFSSDIQEVAVIYTVNYQIYKEKAPMIYRNIGGNYLSTVVEPSVSKTVKEAFAKYNAETLLASRQDLAQEIQDDLSAQMASYNIEIISTAIEDIDFSDSFTIAVEAKQVAEQNKLKAQTEQEQKVIEAEAQARRDIIEAQAKADAAMVAAENDAAIAKIAADSAEYQGKKDAAIMSAIGEMLAKYPGLIQYYYTTNWDGKLPETMLGSGVTSVYPIQ